MTAITLPNCAECQRPIPSVSAFYRCWECKLPLCEEHPLSHFGPRHQPHPALLRELRAVLDAHSDDPRVAALLDRMPAF